ncbi:MAG: tetratricopeptide repeat protein [Chitinophagales bacterium]|nr:tetratricopeptide repeat protein [Chitinophagales bacterium]
MYYSRKFNIPCFLIFIFVINSGIVFGQMQDFHPADTSTINKLNTASLNNLTKDPELSRADALKAIKLSEELKYKKGLGDGYTRLGILEKNIGNYDKALEYHKKSLAFRQGEGDVKATGKSYLNIGTVFNQTGDYDSSIFYLLKAVQIAESLNDQKQLADNTNNLAIAYKRNRDFQLAIKYHDQSLKIAEQLNDSLKIIRSYSNLGATFVETGEYRKSLGYLLYLINKRNSVPPDILADAYNNAGLAYQKGFVEKIDSALYYFKNAADIYSNLESTDLAAVIGNIGLLLFEQGNIKEGISNMEKSVALAQSFGAKELLKNNYQSLANAYQTTGQLEKSIDALNMYILYNDSVFNENKSKDIAELQTKYETAKKDKEIVKMDIENAIQSKRIQQQQLIIGAIVALVIILGLFFSRRQLRKKLEYEQYLNLERSRISSDLHDDIGSTLSSISMYSDVLNGAIKRKELNDAENYSTEIAETSRELLDKMGDLVWAVNPLNDSFDNLLIRVENFGYKLLESKNIEFVFNVAEKASEYELSVEGRHNLYMIMKEVINNAAKYSNASKVEVSISNSKKELQIVIRDNGIGFNALKNHDGNGLKNIRRRAKAINAELTVNSGVELGTSVIIKLNNDH